MKIRLITRHFIVNYGSFLQTYATCNFFEELGYPVEVIDYIPSSEETFRVIKEYLKGNSRWNKNIFSRIIYLILKYPGEKIAFLNFRKIQKHSLVLSKKLKSVDEIEVYIENKGKCIYCAGSDQLWGPMPSGTYDDAYFLKFEREYPKISFSSSIGRSVNFDEKVINLLKQFAFISCRENSAKKYLEGFLGLPMKTILDPTLLVDRDIWLKRINGITKKDFNKKYILFYQLHPESNLDVIREYYIKNGFNIINISPSFGVLGKKGVSKYVSDPFLFLAYINHAEAIVTDSFHGTCFSLLLEKEFYSYVPEKTGTRIKELLDNLNLEERAFNTNSLVPEIISERKIDYLYVNNILQEKRSEDIEWFTKQLGKVIKNNE